MKKIDITASKQILIAKLHLFDHDSSGTTTKVENFYIKAISTTKIQMVDHCYKLKGVDTSRDLADSADRYYSRFLLHRNGNTDRSPIAR